MGPNVTRSTRIATDSRGASLVWVLLVKWRGIVSDSLSADFNTSVSEGFRSTHPSFLNAF
eukprot:11247889-Ditylum_brightwellii.AAC.1